MGMDQYIELRKPEKEWGTEELYFRKWYELHDWFRDNQPETFAGNYYGSWEEIKPEVLTKLRKAVYKTWIRYEMTGKLYHLDNTYFRKSDEVNWSQHRYYLEKLYNFFQAYPEQETMWYEADW